MEFLMGYRSDVALVLSKKGNEELSKYYHSLSEDARTELESLINFSDKHCLNKKGEHLFIWESYKWYAGFPDVDLLEKFLNTLNHDEYLFIRIGEDLSDVDELGSFYDNGYDVYINREISYSCNASRHISEWRPNDE
jgi:hypothetical protein